MNISSDWAADDAHGVVPRTQSRSRRTPKDQSALGRRHVVPWIAQNNWRHYAAHHVRTLASAHHWRARHCHDETVQRLPAANGCHYCECLCNSCSSNGSRSHSACLAKVERQFYAHQAGRFASPGCILLAVALSWRRWSGSYSKRPFRRSR